jgi:hypothetical protein
MKRRSCWGIHFYGTKNMTDAGVKEAEGGGNVKGKPS